MKRKIRPYSVRKKFSSSRIGALVAVVLAVFVAGSALAAHTYFTPETSREKVVTPVESNTQPPVAEAPVSEPIVTVPIDTPVVPTPGIIPTPVVVPNPGTSSLINPLLGAAFFINTNSSVFRANDKTSDPAQLQKLNKISAQPIATWIVGSTDLTKLSATLGAAPQQNATPIIVLYNIPQLGCSGSGAPSVAAYKEWVDRIVDSVGSTKPVVILEPDAVPLAGCLSEQQRKERFEALSYATGVFVAKGAAVYIDAGHSNWGKNPSVIAQRLILSGVKNARGVSVNVSNYQTTDNSVAYAREILQLLGGGGAVVDTSRNGVGPTPDNEWCNAPGRKLGISPRVSSDSFIDAYLWIKYPGESDGSCYGGTPEGTWWQDYALNLAS